jgi:hypothetical protein
MRKKDYPAAKREIETLMGRFRQTPEYVCSWDWEAFLRWLDKIASPEKMTLHLRIKEMVAALDCEKNVTNAERVAKLQKVADWLGSDQ